MRGSQLGGKPELLERVPARMRGVQMPRLGARLVHEGKRPPTVERNREAFGFSAAAAYFEFAVDSSVSEGL